MTENLRTIYFDESGYTGYDLLNSDQPIFSIASSDVDDDEAHAILRDSFPNYQGAEFKFSRLWSRPRRRQRLVAFSEHLARVADRTFVYNCDKKFTALTKTVDTLSEPLAHDAGYDFYAGGFNRGYVNMFHYALRKFGEPELYDAIIGSYDRFSRSPNEETLSQLQWRLRLMANSCPSTLEPFIKMLADGAEHYHEYQNIGLQLRSNDIQLSCVLSSICFWRIRTDDDLEVIHDDSSNFFRQIGDWERITSPEVLPIIVTTGDGREVEFPLRVVDTLPGNSADSRALQLCDMIAGLSARLLHNHQVSIDSGLRREIIEAGFGKLTCDGIRPDTNFIDGTPSELDGPDTIDQFNAAVAQHRSQSVRARPFPA